MLKIPVYELIANKTLMSACDARLTSNNTWPQSLMAVLR